MKYKICATLSPDLASSLFAEELNTPATNLSLSVFNYPFSLPPNLTIDMLCNDNLVEYLPLRCGLSISEALTELREEELNLKLDVKPL